MTNPCFHCADRHPVCHDTCERYKAWQEFYAAEVADKRRKNDACTIHKTTSTRNSGTATRSGDGDGTDEPPQGSASAVHSSDGGRIRTDPRRL